MLPIIPVVFRFSNSVTADTSVSDLEKRVITELCEDARVPFANLFFTVVIQGMCFRSLQYAA